MAYEALARKWRPRTFGEVVGQGHVARALANAISLGKIHHAYLFCGTRGVGKTTFARILARALNCENGPTATPCLACPACLETLSGSAVDVQEIDGASNTGIDDVRRLREGAAYAPSRLRYKVYIIDEVHMLSKAAFNGLLKILEEPPSHVVFVFATTEPNRIPETILSRVQRFDFRMLTEEEICARLREIASAEGIRAEEAALRLLARCAFGSMRDAQSIFEQAAVLGDGVITAALVEEMLGLVGTEAAIELVAAAVDGGADSALSRFADLAARGADVKFLFLSVIDVLRDAAVFSFTGNEHLLFRHSPSSLERMKELAGKRGRHEWMFFLDVAFRSERDVLATEFPRLGFELLLLRLANALALLPVEALAAPPQEAPGPGRVLPRPSAAVPPTQKGRTTHVVKPAPPRPQAAGAEDLWEAVLRTLRGKRKTILVGLLSQMTGQREGEELVIRCPHELVLERLRDEDKWPVLLSAVEEAAGKKLAVRLECSEKKSPPAEVGPAEEEETRRKALADPLLAEVLREFEGASLVEVRAAPGKTASVAEADLPEEVLEDGGEPGGDRK